MIIQEGVNIDETMFDLIIGQYQDGYKVGRIDLYFNDRPIYTLSFECIRKPNKYRHFEYDEHKDKITELTTK